MYIGFFVAKYIRIFLSILCFVVGGSFYIFRKNIIRQAIGKHQKSLNHRPMKVPEINSFDDRLQKKMD